MYNKIVFSLLLVSSVMVPSSTSSLSSSSSSRQSSEAEPIGRIPSLVGAKDGSSSSAPAKTIAHRPVATFNSFSLVERLPNVLKKKVAQLLMGDYTQASTLQSLLITRSFLLGSEPRCDALAMSPCGNTVITGSSDGKVQLYRYHNFVWRRSIPTNRPHQRVVSLAIGYSSRTVVVGALNSVYHYFCDDTGTWFDIGHCSSPDDHIRSVAISELSGSIIVQFYDRIEIRDLRYDATLPLIDTLKRDGIHVAKVAVSRDGSTIVVGWDDNIIRVYRYKGTKWTVEHETYCTDKVGVGIDNVIVSKDGNKFVTHLSNRKAYINAYQEDKWVQHHISDYVRVLAFSENGVRVVAGLLEGDVKTYRYFRKLAALPSSIKHTGPVSRVVMSANGNTIVSDARGSLQIHRRNGEAWERVPSLQENDNMGYYATNHSGERVANILSGSGGIEINCVDMFDDVQRIHQALSDIARVDEQMMFEHLFTLYDITRARSQVDTKLKLLMFTVEALSDQLKRSSTSSSSSSSSSS